MKKNKQKLNIEYLNRTYQFKSTSRKIILYFYLLLLVCITVKLFHVMDIALSFIHEDMQNSITPMLTLIGYYLPLIKSTHLILNQISKYVFNTDKD